MGKAHLVGCLKGEVGGGRPDCCRGSRKEYVDQRSQMPQPAFIQPLSTDGSVSGLAAAAHDHILPERLTLWEVPGSWQQLWTDSYL